MASRKRSRSRSGEIQRGVRRRTLLEPGFNMSTKWPAVKRLAAEVVRCHSREESGTMVSEQIFTQNNLLYTSRDFYLFNFLYCGVHLKTLEFYGRRKK